MKGSEMNTERMKELLAEFGKNGITHDVKQRDRFNMTLEFQDLIGRASMPEIAEFEKNIDWHERKLFFFAVTACVGIDQTQEIIKKTIAERIVRERIEEAAADNECVFADRMKEIDGIRAELTLRLKRIEEKEAEQAGRKAQIQRMEKEIAELKEKNRQLEMNAREALRVITPLQTALKELQEWENRNWNIG